LKFQAESVFSPERTSNISSNKTSNTFTLMPDFLTRRNGTWRFARRVPTEFAHLDRRGVVKHSTKIRIASDRAAVRASRVAEKFNSSLEQHWRVLADSGSKEAVDSYNEARRRARQFGFNYIENTQLVAGPAAERLDRLETLVAKDLVNDAGARQAVLGLKKKPVFKVSKIFEEYEAETKDQVLDLSPDQLRIWRNARKRVLTRRLRTRNLYGLVVASARHPSRYGNDQCNRQRYHRCDITAPCRATLSRWRRMGKQVEWRLGSALIPHSTRSKQRPGRRKSIGDDWKTRLGSIWLTNVVCWSSARDSKSCPVRASTCGNCRNVQLPGSITILIFESERY
jgi:hypothetical protein